MNVRAVGSGRHRAARSAGHVDSRTTQRLRPRPNMRTRLLAPLALALACHDKAEPPTSSPAVLTPRQLSALAAGERLRSPPPLPQEEPPIEGRCLPSVQPVPWAPSYSDTVRGLATCPNGTPGSIFRGQCADGKRFLGKVRVVQWIEGTFLEGKIDVYRSEQLVARRVYSENGLGATTTHCWGVADCKVAELVCMCDSTPEFMPRIVN